MPGQSCLEAAPLRNRPLYLGQRNPNVKLLGYSPFLVQPIVLSFHSVYYLLLRARHCIRDGYSTANVTGW